MRDRECAYVGIYAVIALAVLAWCVSQIKAAELPLLLQFLVVAVALTYWHVELGTAVQPLSVPIQAAALIMLPTHLAVLVNMSIVTNFRLIRPWTLSRLAFNLSNHIVPAALAGQLFTISGYREHLNSPLGIGVAFAVMGVHYLLNIAAGSIYVSLRDGRPARQVAWNVIRANGWSAPSYRVMALLMALAYADGGSLVLLLGAALVVCMRHQAELYAKREILTRSARLDGLTEVGNRHAWSELLNELNNRPQGPYILISFDLDGMKTVNDTLGHETGDNVLRSFSGRLIAAVGADRAFRFGGDEFVVLLTRKGPGDIPETEQLFHGILEDFENEWAARGVQVSASMGIAVTEDAANIPQALRAADRAMYRHKRRNTHLTPQNGAR